MARCGNFERSVGSKEEWIHSHEGIICPDCGAQTIGVVRATKDVFPRLKIRAHEAPTGVTPAPYAFQELRDSKALEGVSQTEQPTAKMSTYEAEGKMTNSDLVDVSGWLHLAEVAEYADYRGVSRDQAILELVNKGLSLWGSS